MGTQKKIVLASVVSMMLVLAFMVGFVPSYDATSTGAAGSEGRVDMAGLLDMILGDKLITALVPASSAEGVTFQTPVTNFEAPYIPVALTATATGVGGDTYYVIDPATALGFRTDADGLPYWTGPTDQYTGPVPAPTFPGTFDLGTKVPVTPGLVNYALNSLAVTNSAYGLYTAPGGAPTYIYYNVKNATPDQIAIGLNAVAGSADANGNALPDDVFSATAGGAWVANANLALTGEPQVRKVNIQDISFSRKSAKAPGDTVVIPVTPEVTVEVPSEAALFAAGVIGSSDSVVAVVSVTDDLSGAVDGTQADRDQWASDVLAGAPGTVIPGAPIVQIALVANVAGVPTQLNDLGGLTAKVNITGVADLAANENKGVAVWGVHVDTDGSTFTATDPATALHIGDGAPVVDYVNGTIEAVLSTFSAFVPLYSELLITDIDPKLVPANIPGFQVPVTLTGIFPTAMAANVYAGLTVDEAIANYNVIIDGALASFRGVDTVYTGLGGVQDTANVAVTALQTNPLVPNKMYLTLSDITLAKAVAVDVTVQSVTNPGNSFTLTATLEFAAAGEVVVTTSGSGVGRVGTDAEPLSPPYGSITLTESGILNFPAGWYLIGDAVTATAYPESGSDFVAWSVNGTVQGNTPTLNFNVGSNPTNLDAQFDVQATTFPLTVVPPVDGIILAVPAQPVGGYVAGTTVTLTATPLTGFAFNTWTGPNAGDLQPNALAPVVTLVMNGAKTVGADFLAVALTSRLTLTAGMGGTVAAVPLGISGGTLYNTGTAVTITATASANYLFDTWTGADAGALADPTNPVQNIVMDADKEYIANFRQVLNITAITPNNAWIFGGVVARVSGTGLSATTQFTLGGETVWGFNAAADGSSIDIVIPATDDRSDNALVITTLTASQGAVVTPALPFTYKRYFEDPTTGMNTTAFILDTPAVENTVKLDTGGGDITSGNLIIPGLNTGASQVYGIVLDQKLVVGATKATTAPVPVGDLSGTLIDAAAAGSGIPNAYDFSIFLYKAAVTKQTTPPAQSSIYVDASADLGATLGQGQDASGIPNAGTAMKVTLPLDGTGLTYADVRKGLALWGIEAQYDYASNTESITDPKVEAYQSELLQNEVDPNMTATTPDADQPDQMLKARIYSLNGFSLRNEWTLPEDVAAAVRLAKVDGKAVSGTGSGPVCGGTVLTLVSPLGGLGYVDRVVMRQPAKLGGALGGTATETLFVSKPGVDEYTFEFKTPKSGKAGIVDIVIYLKSSPDTPAAVLSKTFEYKAGSANLTPLLLILLGLLLALIGIAAGGDSGGGGGGPCFIATAAYGTPLVAEIDTLRTVRDTYLLDNAVGSAFVDSYYRVSPAIADAVAQSPVLAAAVRLVLVPVIFLGKLALLMPAPMALLAMALAAVYMLRRRARGRA